LEAIVLRVLLAAEKVRFKRIIFPLALPVSNWHPAQTGPMTPSQFYLVNVTIITDTIPIVTTHHSWQVNSNQDTMAVWAATSAFLPAI
jgi:hypothetical protein